MIGSIVLTAICLGTAFGQDPVIDNERVTVWDVTWAKGTANPAGTASDLEDTALISTTPDGAKELK